MKNFEQSLMEIEKEEEILKGRQWYELHEKAYLADRLTKKVSLGEGQFTSEEIKFIESVTGKKMPDLQDERGENITNLDNYVLDFELKLGELARLRVQQEL